MALQVFAVTITRTTTYYVHAEDLEDAEMAALEGDATEIDGVTLDAEATPTTSKDDPPVPTGREKRADVVVGCGNPECADCYQEAL